MYVPRWLRMISRARSAPLVCFLFGIVLPVRDSASGGVLSRLVREQKTIVVDGVPETWRLKWDKRPTIACGADDPSISGTCPCSGFAYGQQGDLTLVLIRRGAVADRLELDPFFIRDELPGDGPAVLQRWPASLKDVNIGDNDATLMREVVDRGSVDVMRFADYDHDGGATEFLLQIGTLPCGKHQMVLVGISKRNRHLHVFRSVERPKEPLVLGSWQWEALLKSHGTITTIEWPCGDHGSDYEWTDTLSARDGLLHDVRKSRKCGRGEQENAPFDSTPPR